MARRRMIEVSIAHDERLNEISEWTQLLYLRILPHTDDMGRFSGSPKVVKARAFPMSDRSVNDVRDAIVEMIEIGLVSVYQATDGGAVLQLKRKSFNRINAVLIKNNKGLSEYHEPSRDDLMVSEYLDIVSRGCHVVVTCKASDIESKEQKVESKEQGGCKGGATDTAPPKPRKDRPADLAEIVALFIHREIPDPEAQAEAFLAHYESNGWKVGKAPMADWKAAVTTWKQNLPRFGPQAPRPGYTADGKPIRSLGV